MKEIIKIRAQKLKDNVRIINAGSSVLDEYNKGVSIQNTPITNVGNETLKAANNLFFQIHCFKSRK